MTLLLNGEPKLTVADATFPGDRVGLALGATNAFAAGHRGDDVSVPVE